MKKVKGKFENTQETIEGYKSGENESIRIIFYANLKMFEINLSTLSGKLL